MGKGKLFSKSAGQAFPAAGQLKEAACLVKKGGSGVDGGKKKQGMSKSKLGFKMNKKLGQHLLKNPGVVTKIVQAGDIKKSDVVLEIGPGTGNLTIQLCGLARKVRALEIDPRMVAEVKKRVLAAGYSNIEVVQGDALTSDFGDFQVCTANLPYQISSPFIFHLLTRSHNFRCAVLMFQKEFGERLVAQPNDKNYCRLGVNTQLFCTITRVCLVAAASFNPPPKVDSIVVKLVPKKNRIEIDYAQWDGMLRIVFSRKRRTLRAIFRTGKTARKLMSLHQAYTSSNGQVAQTDDGDNLTAFKDKLTAILESTGFVSKRAVNLSIPDFTLLLAAFHAAGIYFPIEEGKKKFMPGAIPKTLFADMQEEDADSEEENNDMADE